MFEERFGRKAATVLLFLVTVALVSVCVSLISANIILPIYRAATYVTGDASLYSFLSNKAVSIGFSAICFIFVTSVINAIIGIYVKRRFANIIASAEEKIEKLEGLNNRLTARLTAIEPIVDEMVKRAQTIKEAEHRLGILPIASPNSDTQ